MTVPRKVQEEVEEEEEEEQQSTEKIANLTSQAIEEQKERKYNPLRGTGDTKKRALQSFMVSSKVSQFIDRLPKVELHVHLPGAFDLEVIYNAKKDSTKFKTFAEFRANCTCKGKRSLQEMLFSFNNFQRLVEDDFELVETLAYTFVQQQMNHRIIYTEVRYSPHLISKTHPRRAFRSVTAGLRRGCEEFGATVNQILCCIDRQPEWSETVVDIAYENNAEWPCAVVGVDVAAGEDYFKERHEVAKKLHFEAILKAQRLGLNITIHAGEAGGLRNVEMAIDEFKASRIGHGYAVSDLVNSPGYRKSKLHKKILNLQTHFEVCLSSSFETGGWKGDDGDLQRWNRHPVLDMKKAGYSFSLNTDDPTVFETDMSRELRIAMKEVGLTEDDIVNCMREAITCSFATKAQHDMVLKALTPYDL